MNTLVKMFFEEGRGGEERLENGINQFAYENNLDIVSAIPCFKRGFLDDDGMFVVVVFRKKED